MGLQRRSVRIGLALLVLAIVVRVSLPTLIRRVAVDQADKALIGRLEIDDVDLALLTGGITLRGLRVYADDLTQAETQHTNPEPSGAAQPASNATPNTKPPSTAEAPAGTPAPPETPALPDAPAPPDTTTPPEATTPPVTNVPGTSPTAPSGAPVASAPVFTASRLFVDIAWWPLLHKIVEVQAIELEQFDANIDRLADGTLVLPQPVPSEPEPETPPAEEPTGAGWGVLVERLSLRQGHVAFRDFTVSADARPLEASIPSMEAANMTLLITDTGLQPGTASLDADVLGGHLRFELKQRNVAAGQAFESHVVLTDLPIADARVYVPRAEWTALDGRLDVDLVHRFEPEGPNDVSGSVALRDLSIRVGGLDQPPLTWKKLGIDIGDVDLVKHNAKISLVALQGARLIARAAGPEPLPVLRGILEAGDTNAAAGNAATGPKQTNASGKNESEAPAWNWQLDKVTLHDTGVDVLGGDAPVALEIDAEVRNLASAPETRSNADLKVKPPAGTLALNGAFTIDPLSFDGTLKLDAVALAPLSTPVATPVTRLLREGAISTDLNVALGATPSAPTDGVQVSGTIALDGFLITGEDEKAFAIRWKQLALDIESVRAAGLLSKDASSAAREPVEVSLTSFDFERPEIVATRAEHGIVLPAALNTPAENGEQPKPRTAGTETARTADAAAQESEADVGADESVGPVVLRVARLAIKQMRIGVTDKTVTPLYRTTLDPLDFSATDIRWPGPHASAIDLTAKGLDGATLTVTGDVGPTESRLKAKLDGMPLAPLNPYAALAGYGLAGGAASLRSNVELKGDSYKTDNKLVLNKLAVTGAGRDSRFAQQFGMPLSLALALMTDLQGNITLNIPVAGGRGGTSIGIGTAVRDALKQAILSTATSPLKLIGAVADIGQKPTSLAPQPIAFRPGRALEAEGEAVKLDQFAKVLSSTPALMLRLHGEACDADRRWLAEQKLLAQLEQETGLLSAVRHLGEGDERDAAVVFLRARAEDKPARIDEGYKAWLEAKVAAQTVSDAELRALAEERAGRVRTKVLDSAHIASERVVVDPVAPEDLAARSAVTISLETAASPSSAPTSPH